MAKLKGLELLYNLLLKDAVKTSGPRSGILSIGPDTRKFAQKRFQAFVEGAKRQGVDLDKYTEQELKYIIELNKPKSPKVIPADSPEGKGITEALFGKKGEVIKADFGKSFKESITDDIIRDINNLESIPAMKEVNKVIKREGKYKNLTDEDVDKIFKGTEDRTSGRLDDVDPEDMATGGRAGFKDGMSRRKFLQIMGGLGAIPIVGKFLKFGKAAKSVKAAPIVTTPPVKGKPAWFDSLVNKVIAEGEDVTKKFATKDREVVHIKALDDETTVYVYRDLDEGTVRVDIDDPVRNVKGEQEDALVSLEFKPGMADETTKGKPADQFTAVENDYRNYMDGPDDYVTETIENSVTDTKDLTSDLTKIKLYAKGQEKPTMKEFIESKKRKEQVQYAEEQPSQYAADRGPDIDYSDYDEYASGGIAGMLGE